MTHTLSLTAPLGQTPGDIALAYMRRSPPTDLMGLAADLGLRIQYAQLEEDAGRIEALAGFGAPKVLITLNQAHGHNQQRFMLAHGIAHYIQHRPQVEAGPIVDNALYRSRLPEAMEWAANRYAAQLLMPLSAMEKLWGLRVRAPADVAVYLGVSEAAARLRLDQLRDHLGS